MVLCHCLVLDLILTLDMDTQSMGHTALELCWLVLDNEGVLRLLEEDRKSIVDRVSIRKIVRKKWRRQVRFTVLFRFLGCLL